MPPVFRRNFQSAVLFALASPSSYCYGTITLFGAPFQGTSHSNGRVDPGPTSPCGLPHGFGLPCSVFDRLYSRNHDCFLFLCLLRCFNSAGTLSLMRMALRPGGPIRQSSVHRLLAPTRGNIAAWHDLHRLPSRAIPHLVCSNTTEVELDVSIDFDFLLSPGCVCNVR